MAKYRIHVNVVNETDGTAHPFLGTHNEPLVIEGEGFAIFGIADHKESVEVSAALNDVSVAVLAHVIAGDEHMKRAAKLALVKDILKNNEGGGEDKCRLYNMRYWGRVKPING